MTAQPETQPFWDGCARGELLLQRCDDCAAVRHPPSPICPHCRSPRHVWIASSGRGTVYTFTVVRQAIARGWGERVPYVVAVIALDEGPHVLSNLVNVAPEDVTIGMRVAVTFAERDGTQLPFFAPMS